MSTTQAHIAALFATTTAAHAAQAALIAAGIPATQILVLDRGNPDSGAHTAHGLWAALKSRLLPDTDSHHYAEGVTRGHPLLVVEVDLAQHDLAVATLVAQHPLDVEEHATAWRAEGWEGTHAGQEEWLQAQDDDDEPVASSEGIVGGNLLTGDYGAVGAPVGGAMPDTDIQRGVRVRVYRLR